MGHMGGKAWRPPAVSSLRDLAERSLPGGSRSDLSALTQDEIRTLAEELDVHRVELEIQNQVLAEAQLAAEKSQEHYRQLYESAPIGYLTLDPEGVIVTANLYACERLGVPRTRILGRKFSSFVAEDRQDAWHFGRRALTGSGRRQSVELELVRADGAAITAQLVGPGRCESDGRTNLALLDVTELRSTERALRKAASEASLAEHRERRKLASDLHDDVGQLLSLVSFKLRAITDAVTDERHAQLQELWRLLAAARSRVTSLSFQLSPPPLKDVGLLAAAHWLAEDLKGSYGLEVSIEAREELALEEPARVTLFRALRELLINVKKHAEVDRARVRIWHEGPMVRLAVEDEGIGFGEKANLSGFGLLALRERLGQLGGSLSIEAGSGGVGSRVVASVPDRARSGESS